MFALNNRICSRYSFAQAGCESKSPTPSSATAHSFCHPSLSKYIATPTSTTSTSPTSTTSTSPTSTSPTSTTSTSPTSTTSTSPTPPKSSSPSSSSSSSSSMSFNEEFAHRLFEANKTIPNNQKITSEEIGFLLKEISKIKLNPTLVDNPLWLRKRDTGLQHGFLIYKNERQQLCIIIKPKIKNPNKVLSQSTDPLLEVGTYKIVKKSGVRISLDLSSQSILSVEKIITVSKSNYYQCKDKSLQKVLGGPLLEEGYEEIRLGDRQWYVQIDKGENLSNLIKKLPLAERKKIARQLIEQFKSNPNRGDIKIGNILYDCISQKAYFIDDKSMMFSYTTQSANSSGHYEERKSDDKELIKQQLLGLTIILYQLLNGYDGHDILGTMPQLNFLYEGGFLASVVQSTEKSKTYKY